MRRLLISIVAICVVALGVFALANRPVQAPGDDIIIKGGSLEITCGSNQGAQCLGFDSATGKYHVKNIGHMTKIVVMDSHNTVLYDSSDPNHCGGGAFDSKSEIHVTYK